MECADIKELLSDYIDGALDPQARAIVEEHLPGCEGCREELMSLKTLIQELSSLDAVKAPSDFLEKVHERVERRSRFLKIIRMFFVPMRIKIPLQFATVAATAVLVFIVFNMMQPAKEIIEEPSLSRQIRVGEKSSTDSVESSLKKPAYKPKAALKSVTKPQLAREDKPIELALLIRTEIAALAPAPSVMSEAPILEEEVLAKDEDNQVMYYPPREQTAKGAKQRARSKAKRPSAKKPTSAGESGKEIRSKNKIASPPPQWDEAISGVHKLIELMGGEIISSKYMKETGQLQYITTEIPAKNYIPFFEKLTQLGVIQPPPPAIPAKDQERFQVRIQFIFSN